MHGKRVGIYVRTRRFRCNECSKTSFKRLRPFRRSWGMTDRLVRWIGAQSLKRTFSSVAEDVGVTSVAGDSVRSPWLRRPCLAPSASAVPARRVETRRTPRFGYRRERTDVKSCLVRDEWNPRQTPKTDLDKVQRALVRRIVRGQYRR
jgi:hypothetical protein